MKALAITNPLATQPLNPATFPRMVRLAGQFFIQLLHANGDQENIPLETHKPTKAGRKMLRLLPLLRDDTKPFSFIIEDEVGEEQKIMIMATDLERAINKFSHVQDTPHSTMRRCRLLITDQNEVAQYQKIAVFYHNGSTRVQFKWLQATTHQQAAAKFADRFPQLTLVDLAFKPEFGRVYRRYFPKNGN